MRYLFAYGFSKRHYTVKKALAWLRAAEIDASVYRLTITETDQRLAREKTKRTLAKLIVFPIRGTRLYSKNDFSLKWIAKGIYKIFATTEPGSRIVFTA